MHTISTTQVSNISNSIVNKIKSNVFYDALYKNIPNSYILHHIYASEHLATIFEHFYDHINDYYIEKMRHPDTQAIEINSVYIVLAKDILIHIDTPSNTCIIMYASATKKTVQNILYYMMQFQKK